MFKNRLSVFLKGILLFCIISSCDSIVDQQALQDKLLSILSNQSANSNTTIGSGFDNVAPTLILATPQDGQDVGGLCTISGVAGDLGSGLANVLISIDNGTFYPVPIFNGIFQTNVVINSYQIHTIALYAVDKATNKSVIKTFTVRRCAIPSITLDYPRNGIWTNKDRLVFEGIVSIDYPYHITKIEISTNRTDYFDLGSTLWKSPALKMFPDRTNTIQVRAIGNNGKTNVSSEHFFIVDAVGPVIDFRMPVSNITVGTNSFQTIGTIRDIGYIGVKESFFQCNTGVFKKLISPTNWQSNLSLNMGTNIVKIYGVDKYGNVGSTNTRTIVFIDTTRPVVSVTTPILSQITIESNSYQIKGVVSDIYGSGIDKIYLRKSGIIKLISGTSTWSTNLTPTLGTNLFEVFTRDKAGNYSITNQFKIVFKDITRPQIFITQPIFQYVNSKINSFSFSGVNTEYLASGIKEIRLFHPTSAIWYNYGATSSASWAINCMSGNIYQGSNRMGIYLVDNAGNVSYTNTSFIVFKDTIPPYVHSTMPSGSFTVVETHDMVVSGYATDISGSGMKSVNVTLNGGYIPGGQTNWSYYVSFSDGTNKIVIKAIDKADNTNYVTNIVYKKYWKVCGGAPISLGSINGSGSGIPGLASYSGYVYAGFSDCGISGRGVVKKFNGTSWQTVGTAGFTPGSIADSSLAIGSDGIPYFAFRDNSCGNKISVMALNGSSWNYVGSSGFSDNPGYYPSIAVNGTTPILAYEDTGHQLLMVRYFDSGSGTWKHFGPDMYGKSMGDVRFISLKLYNNTMYYAWVDVYYSSKFNCAYFNGSFCASVGDTLSASPANIDCTSLAISASGIIYIAFVDSSGKVWIKAYNGSSWYSMPTHSYFESTGSSWVDIAVDGETPYVVFSDGLKSSCLTVMKYNGSSWEVVGSSGFTGNNAAFNKIIVVNGVPYVLFKDSTQGDRAVVMMFN